MNWLILQLNNESFFFSFKEEEVDHITMNFVSFSGNKISAQLVLDFFTWQLMRRKDPLLLHVSNTALAYKEL